MSECLMTRRGGAGLPPSIAYPIVAILTESTTWTVPESGTYQISCIGSGGAAVAWVESESSSINILVGGGAGGIAESQLKISKGTAIPVTISDAVTSFGNYLSASAGQDGHIVQSIQAVITSSSGSGGNASGGNIGNYIGGNGYVRTDIGLIGGITNSNAKYGGSTGNVACISDVDFSGYTIVLATKKEYGKSQYGVGQGECVFKGQSRGTRSVKVTPEPNGAIIIERVK